MNDQDCRSKLQAGSDIGAFCRLANMIGLAQVPIDSTATTNPVTMPLAAGGGLH